MAGYGFKRIVFSHLPGMTSVPKVSHVGQKMYFFESREAR